MAAITYAQIVARRDALMRLDTRCAIIVNKPDATSDGTAALYLVKDPDPGDTGNTTATAQGNAKGGAGHPWKAFSYLDLGTAYSLP